MDNILTKYRSFWICAGLALATTAVYYQVCTYDFVNYDDNIYVYKNPNIRAGITLETIKWSFLTNYSRMYHPLTWLSLMLDWQLFGLNAGGYHLINLIFHIANTLLLFIILKRMTNAVWPSEFAAALFALHPLHVESVAWVTERKDVLSTFFWMLTAWAYIRYVNRPKIISYLLIVIFYALSLLSKPMVVTLPFVLLLLDYWPLERLSFKRVTDSSKHSPLYLLIEKIPLFAMVLVLGIVTFVYHHKGESTASLEDISIRIRIYNALVSYMQYIIKMIWPSRLAFFYPHPGRNISFLFVVISAIILLVITIFILRSSKKHRYLFTGWFWFLGMLVPVIGLVQAGSQAMADRYSYMALTGLFIIIAWGLPEMLWKWPHRKIALWVSSLMVLSVLSVCSFIQQRYWKDTIALCQHALKVTNHNFQAHFCMSVKLLEQDRIEEAIRHSTEAVQIVPDYAGAITTLGIALQRSGRIDEAIPYYKKALKIDPHSVEVYANYGSALAAKGRLADAISLYNKGLQSAPDSVELHINLGIALTGIGKPEEAVKEYEKVLKIDPQNIMAHINLGMALTGIGKPEEAVKEYEKVLKIDPQNIMAHNNLGNALAGSGRLEEAVREYEKVLNIEPQNFVVLANLCTIFLEQGKAEEAVREYRKYLKIKPDNPEVLESLGIILFQQGKIDEAFKCFTETLRIDSNRPQGHYYLGQILAQQNKIDEATAHLEDALRLEPNWVEPMNDLAWYLAASEKSKAHNPDRAIKLAQRACELTNYSSPHLLDTLATAYAAAGNFGKAVEITEKALEMCRSDEQKAVKEELEKRLVLYKAGKPYIER